MKYVWNLCQNLWGDIPNDIKSNPASESGLSMYELEQIRKRLLGEWLTDSCSHRIDRECKMLRFNKVTFEYKIFSQSLIEFFFQFFYRIRRII
jgi:hypothetical protein